jgi:hypothetical protein
MSKVSRVNWSANVFPARLDSTKDTPALFEKLDCMHRNTFTKTHREADHCEWMTRCRGNLNDGGAGGARRVWWLTDAFDAGGAERKRGSKPMYSGEYVLVLFWFEGEWGISGAGGGGHGQGCG